MNMYESIFKGMLPVLNANGIYVYNASSLSSYVYERSSATKKLTCVCVWQQSFIVG